MIEKRCVIACRVLWREISYLASKSPYIYDIFYLEQGLHNDPADLNKKLQEKINEIESNYSTILIGYGLCSNGIEGIFSSNSTLVFIRAHDCITLFLGSKQRYRKIFDNHPGTYWYNTGWIETSDIPNEDFYREKYIKYSEEYDEDTAEFLVESEKEWLSKYNTVSYIRQDITEEKSYIEYSRQSAKYLNWDFKIFEGDLGLINDWINGNWDDERFLVVSPSYTVIPSYDEKIINKTKKNETEDKE